MAHGVFFGEREVLCHGLVIWSTVESVKVLLLLLPTTTTTLTTYVDSVVADAETQDGGSSVGKLFDFDDC